MLPETPGPGWHDEREDEVFGECDKGLFEG